MSDPITIRRLIDRITSGDIRIPAFQRDFVWEPEQVAFLLDSIYKGFPIGTVILWKTDTRLKTEKRLGLFELPEPQKDYPVNYVLDGQQRLTSLFRKNNGTRSCLLPPLLAQRGLSFCLS